MPNGFPIEATQTNTKTTNGMRTETKTLFVIFFCLIKKSNPITDNTKAIKNINRVGCEDEIKGTPNSYGSLEMGFSVANNNATTIVPKKNNLFRLRSEANENITKTKE